MRRRIVVASLLVVVLLAGGLWAYQAHTSKPRCMTSYNYQGECLAGSWNAS
jgi:hypothetical protein